MALFVGRFTITSASQGVVTGLSASPTAVYYANTGQVPVYYGEPGVTANSGYCLAPGGTINFGFFDAITNENLHFVVSAGNTGELAVLVGGT